MRCLLESVLMGSAGSASCLVTSDPTDKSHPIVPFPSYRFWAQQACSDLTEKSLSDLTEKSSLGPGHKESDSPRCLSRAHCHPSLHITVLHICSQSELASDQGTQASLKT